MGFNPSNTDVPGPTKAGSSVNDKHQFTGSVYVSGNIYAQEYHMHVISSSISYASGSHKFGDDAGDLQQMTGTVAILGALSSSMEMSASGLYTDGTMSASYFVGNGSALTNLPGGGGGGISWDGSTANGIATFKDSDEATVESKLTFDGAANKLSLTGTLLHTGSHHLSGTLTMTGPVGLPLLVMDDTDASAQIGRAHIGYDGADSDMAIFAHQDHATAGSFALRQRGAGGVAGQTDINAANSRMITFSINSSNRMRMDGTGLGIGTAFSPAYLLDVSGSTRHGANVGADGESHNEHYITGAIIQTGSTATFHVADHREGAFVVSGSTGGYNPTLGLLNVDTSANWVRFGGGIDIPNNWNINFGDSDGAGSSQATIGYNGANLIISGGLSGAEIRVTSSVHFANDVHIAGTLQGASPLEIAGEVNMAGDVNMTGDLIRLGQDCNDVIYLSSSLTASCDTLVESTVYFSGTHGEQDSSIHVPRWKTDDQRLEISGTIEGVAISSSLYLVTHANSIGDAVSLLPDEGKYTFVATGFEASNFIVSGTAVITGSAHGPGAHDPDGTLFTIEGGSQVKGQGKPVLYAQASGGLGYVGISHGSPKVELDIRWDSAGNPNNFGNNSGGGEIVSFATGTTTAGALYYLNEDQAGNVGWASASAHETGSGHDQMLGLALGTNAQNDGMLIRGWFNATTFYQDRFVAGGAVWVASSSAYDVSTWGHMSGSEPREVGSYRRIVGYASPNGNLIYFNPAAMYEEVYDENGNGD